MNELALFAGAGGGILGGKLLGWTTVCAVEIDEYARRVLLARQDDGCIEPFPIWDDVCTFDGRPWRGVVDIVTGGFPCQDISSAGKGTGITGERSGLWKEMGRIIGEVRPRFVLVENSPVLTSRGLGVVLGDMAAMGYDAEWGVLGASDTGAPHRRERIWIVGSLPDSGHGTDAERARGPRGKTGEWASIGVESASNGEACSMAGEIPNAELLRCNTGLREQEGQQSGGGREARSEFAALGEDVAHANGGRLEQCDAAERAVSESHALGAAMADAEGGGLEEPRGPGLPVCAAEDCDGEASGPMPLGWWVTEPDVGRVANGVAARVDRLRCLGNGQVSAVVRLAWKTLNP
jgi:DNA (cytosine-5)-methyltransferase 1